MRQTGEKTPLQEYFFPGDVHFENIDSVMVDGRPFIFDANWTPIPGPDEDLNRHSRNLLKTFAKDMSRILVRAT